MKFKIIINYKSVRECYMAINPMIRKILYSFIGTSLVMSIVFYCFSFLDFIKKPFTSLIFLVKGLKYSYIQSACC